MVTEGGVGGEGLRAGEGLRSAEVDEHGREYLAKESWKSMGTEGGEETEERGIGSWDDLLTRLYGDVPRAELLHVLWLAGTLFFIIGGYWLLRSLKDPIVVSLMGAKYIPRCKIVSLAVVLLLVLVYNRLVDTVPKHQLFYIIGSFYAVLFFAISIMLANPDTGLANTEPSPYRLLGWVSYCSIESFGSITVSLFWAFTNSSMDYEGAKSSYGLIIAGAQLGSILGPSLATQASTIGVSRLYFLGSLCPAAMVAMMWGYQRVFANRHTSGKGTSQPKGAGMMEGFHLLVQHHYLKGIFAISCLFMVEVTILDYTMKLLLASVFQKDFPDDPALATQHFVAFMGKFGQLTNGTVP
ncbi:unnamed protein product [Chrysoparadoxa australica]